MTEFSKCSLLQYMVVNKSDINYVHNVVIKDLFVKFLKLASSTVVVHVVVDSLSSAECCILHNDVWGVSGSKTQDTSKLRDPIGQQQV